MPLRLALGALVVLWLASGVAAVFGAPKLRQAPLRAQEAALRTNLHTLCDALDQYRADRGLEPPSLDALVEDGYLRFVPLDPITKSRETWRVEKSAAGAGGVVAVLSGAEKRSSRGDLYSEWSCRPTVGKVLRGGPDV